MRRADREIADFAEILSILDRCLVMRLAMVDGDLPYLVPLNFGWEAEGEALTLYFHSAQAGRKLDILRKNPNVCFEVDLDHRVVEGRRACEYGFAFASAIGQGVAEMLDDPAEKKRGLDAIMRRLAGDGPHTYDDAVLARTAVVRVRVSQLAGKRCARGG
ncbi:MAG: pyridoxamine 5'-phosphate oxidase family protein [Clostridiales bacterium]|nr:pyridoxamine 5'-phosphate oxidase family protein [Clostridiales bacterium]